MDKKTVMLAEQVGLFLLPTIRSMVDTAVSKALVGFAEKMTGLVQDIERVRADAIERDAAAQKEVLAVIEKHVEQLTTRTSEVSTVSLAIKSELAEKAAEISASIATLKCTADTRAAELAQDNEAFAEAMQKLRDEVALLSVNVRAVASSVTDTATELRGYTDAAITDAVGSLRHRADMVEDSLAGISTAVREVDVRIGALPAPPAADEVARLVLAMVEPKLVESAEAARAELHVVVVGEVEKAVAALPAGLMAEVEPYIDGSVYERAAIVAHGGGTWQATRRTKSAPAPASPDWQTIAVGVAGIDVRASDDLRSVEVVARLSDGTVARSTAQFPAIVYRGVYSATEQYVCGDAVTRDGSLWVLRKPTDAADENRPLDAPGKHSAWQLAVKRGQDGRAGKDGADGVQFQAGYVGEYEENKAYSKNSIVEYAGSLWIAKRPTKERPPYMTGDSNEHWLRVR